MQKTYTIDCFTHKKIKNTGQRTQYRLKNHHPAIIQRDEWISVQEQLQHRRFGNKSKDKPVERKLYLTRIKSGALKGFVLIDPKWKKQDIVQLFEKINIER